MSTSSSKTSWRGSPASNSAAGISWAIGFLLLLIVLLLAFLVYTFISVVDTPPKLNVVTLTHPEPPAYLGPLPFQTGPALFASWDAYPGHRYLFRSSRGASPSLTASSEDWVVVFVRSHGASVEGKPVLLKSNIQFDRELALSDSIETLADLVSEIRQFHTGPTLLALDSPFLSHDLRLGIAHNQFGELMGDAVAELQDDSLWVLFPTANGLPSPVDFGRRDTTFGFALAEGLRGMADLPEYGGDGDYQLTLAELYQFALDQCSAWTNGQQQPLLLRAGSQPADWRTEAGQIVLTQLSAQWNQKLESSDASAKQGSQKSASSTKQDAAANKKQGSDPADNASNSTAKSASQNEGLADGRGKADQAADSAQEGVNSTADPNASAGGKSPDWPTQPLWTQIFRLRSAPDWRPADYAPHYWHDLLLTVVQRERQLRHGQSETAQSELVRIESALRQLANTSASAPGVYPTIQQILEARKQFDASTEKQSFDQAPARLHAARDAIRSYQRQVIWSLTATDVLHQAALYFPSEAPDLDGLTGALALWLNQLETFRSLLDQYDSDPTRDTGRLVQQGAQVENAFQGLQRAFKQLADSAWRNFEQLSYQQIADVILNWPLLEFESRQRLAEAFANPEPRSRRFHNERAAWPTQIAVPRHVRQRQYEVLALHAQPLAMASPDSADRFKQGLAAVGQSPSPANVSALGQQFRAAMLGLIDQAAQGTQAADWSTRRRAQLAAWISDARDLRSLPPPRRLVAPFRLQLPAEAPRLRFAESNRPPMNLTLQPQELQLAVESNVPITRNVQIEVSYPANRVRLLDAQNRPLPAGRVSLPFQDSTRETLVLRVQALQEYTGVGANRADFAFRLIGEGVPGNVQDATRRITGMLPQPDRVDLIVERLAPQAEFSERDNNVYLRPFDGRETRYQFKLVNRSREDKSVIVELYRLLPLSPELVAWPPGVLLNSQQQPFPSIQATILDQVQNRSGLIASSGKQAVTLAASVPAQPVPVPLYAPGQEPVSEPAKSDDSAGSPAQPPQAPKDEDSSQVDVSGGLVMAIRDAGNPSRPPLLKWIELAPIRPEEYLDASLEYKRLEKRLTAVVSPKPGQPLPALLTQQPLKLRMERADVTGEQGNLGESFFGTRPATLYMDLAPTSDARALIFLHVGTSPRSFVFRNVTLDQVASFRDQRADHLAIGIQYVNRAPASTSDGQEQAKKIFLPVRSVWQKPPESTDQVIRVGGDAAATFQVSPDEDLELEVGLRVDALRNAFDIRSIERNAAFIEVALGDNRRKLYSDRQLQALAGFEQGLMSLDVVLSDYVLSLDTAGLLNTKTTLSARLFIRNQEVDISDEPIPIVLDGLAPEPLFDDLLPELITIGQPLTVRISARDVSGLDHVDFAFVKRANDPLGDDAIEESRIRPLEGENIWETQLNVPTDALQPGQSYFFKVALTDKAGWTRVCAGEPVGTMARPENIPIQKGTVVIQTVLKGRNKPGTEVTIPGVGSKKTDNQGRVEFRNVPAGMYKVEAKLFEISTLYVGTVDVALTNKAQDGRVHRLQLAPKE